MRTLIKCLFISVFLFSANVLFAGNIEVGYGGDEEFAGEAFNRIVVTGKATVNGNASANSVTVNTGGVLIVNGNLTISTRSFSTVTNGGTIIVTGDLVIDGGKDRDANIILSDGVLVVGGNYDFGGGTESNLGSVFLSDPNDAGGLDGGTGAVGDMADLIDSEVLTEDLFDNFIDNYDGSGLPSNNWTGGTDAYWDDALNWSEGAVPGKATNVTISSSASNFPTGCSGAKVYTMWNLTLEPGADLTIPSGSVVTIYGDIVIPPTSTLTIENSASNPTSFINHGAINDGAGGVGEVDVNWDYDLDRYWYIGHSISSPDISSYEVNTFKLYKYESGWKAVTGTGDFGTALTGYALKVTGAASNTITHTGELNNSDYEQELVSGFQLITNPYASYYQLSEDGEVSGDFRHTTGSVYIRTGTASRSFETFNTLTNISSPMSFDGVIAPGQCFWIQRSDEESGEVKKVYMSLNKRIHGATSLKSASSNRSPDNYKNLIRVNLENENAVDEAVVAFREFGVLENSRYDSEQRFQSGNSLSYIYTLKEDIGNVISVFPNEFAQLNIPLGMKTKEGIHTISINGLNQIDPSVSVILEDLYEGISINLRENNEYSFDASAGEIKDRFIITLDQISTDINSDLKLDETSSDKITVYSVGNKIMVKLNQDSSDNKTVEVFNLKGAKILQSEFEGDAYSSEPITNKGVYFVKIIENSEETIKKIYIH